MEHEDEIARYARALNVDIDQVRGIVYQQQQLTAITRLKPKQPTLITCDKTKRPSELARYADAMGMTIVEALEEIRAQREVAAQNKDGCARRAATKRKKLNSL